MDEIKLCDYGCGRPAVHPFKNGKWCCKPHWVQCPVVKEKNSRSKEGKEVSEKTKKKISKALSRISISKPSPMEGKKHSKETIKKMSEIKEGEKNPMYGKKHSKESIKKMSEIKEGEKNYIYKKHRSKETIKKISKSTTGEKNPMYGKKHSKETIKKLRLARIKNLKKNIKNNGQLTPNYNPAACKVIDEYGEQHGYNFQHAENGGEFYIKELGYWVDGYDAKKNTVVEGDELHHFDSDGNLLDCDVRRMNEIIEKIKCTFIRLKLNKYNKVINETRVTLN